METEVIRAEVTQTMDIRPIRTGLLLKERLAARDHAEKILSEADRQAKEILERAEAECSNARSKGRQEGRARGYRELAGRVARVGRWQREIREALADRVPELAAEVARRILRREIELDPQSIRRICSRVIRENHPGEQLTLYVHPADLEILKHSNPALTSDPQTLVSIEPADRLERGDCIVQSELGRVDGRLSVQIEELTRAMKEMRDDGRAV